MAKVLAISTQLKNANSKIVELEKKLVNAESQKNTWYEQAKQHEQMLEQLHQVLDAVPGSIARESEGENSWDRVKRTPVTRMAAWLAGRSSCN